MFKPIKGFITFIQKNMNPNSSEDEPNGKTHAMDNIEHTERNGSINTKILKGAEKKAEGMNITIPKCNLVMAKDVAIASEFDKDDIELQIKSSIMLKNPSLNSSTPSVTLKIASSVPSSCTPMHLASVCPKSYTPDYNQNLQRKTHHISPEDDDELADFKNAPIISSSYEDFQSLNSDPEEPQYNSAQEIIDELRSEEGDTVEDPYPHDGSVKNEIIVIVENELNSSITSLSGDDPLAIDISTLPTSSDSANPLDSSTNEENDETLAVSELNWREGGHTPSKITTPSIQVESTSTKHQQHSSEIFANTNVSINTSRNEEMERCDNSDSGLGTETSSLLLQTTPNTSIIASSSVLDGSVPTAENSSSSAIVPETTSSSLRPLRSNLKRRYCDVASTETNNLPDQTNNTKDQNIYSSKRPKRTINFDAVQVYYFPRQQGFGCVPSAGGCTLGMGSQHIDFKRLTLAEHAAELRRAHRLQLQEVNPRGSSSEETDESEEDYLSEGSGSDLDADSNGFLQPVTPKQRRAILKAAGIRKIDVSEKVECRNIRNSREVCGCTCRDFCDPETCSCSRAGIKCQVDRAMFPCGCSRDACGNTTGRVEFNPARVRTHFIHTIMRLDMENRQQQQPATLNVTQNSCNYDSTATPSSVQSHTMTDSATISNHNGYYNLQTQSNYSSGYASPAYPNEHNANFFQPQPITYPAATDETTNVEPSYHNLDTVEGSVPSYGEIIPNYCPNNSTGPVEFDANGYHPSMTYTPNSYMSFQHDQNSSNYLTESQHNSNNNNNIVDSVESDYSSCSVPSGQSYSVEDTCSLSTTTLTTNDSNFISLSTPDASSSRLTQINDLLQHNRNTTAALVAVTQHSGDLNPNTANHFSNSNSNLNSSIETPILNENNKGSANFESSLLKPPSANLSEDSQISRQTKPNDMAIATMPPVEYNSPAAIADYTI